LALLSSGCVFFLPAHPRYFHHNRWFIGSAELVFKQLMLLLRHKKQNPAIADPFRGGFLRQYRNKFLMFYQR